MEIGASSSCGLSVPLLIVMVACAHGEVREEPGGGSVGAGGVEAAVAADAGALASMSVEAEAGADDEGEERFFMVFHEGALIGEASIRARSTSEGRRVHEVRSALTSSRDPSAIRRLHETVVSEEGSFLRGQALLDLAGDRREVRAVMAATEILVSSSDGRSRRMAVPPGQRVLVPIEAARELYVDGSAGDSLLVFDPSTASLGYVTLLERQPGGTIVTEELGIVVESKWSAREVLPRSLYIVHLDLHYVPVNEAGEHLKGLDRPFGEEGDSGVRAARGRGDLRVGREVLLEPMEAFPGLSCLEGRGLLTAAGPICEVDDRPMEGLRSAAGPLVRGLVNEMPQVSSAKKRAAWLADEIKGRLGGAPEGAALWEATAEEALSSGSGDCNEAASVFMAAALLAGLEARRRTGLVADGEDEAGDLLLWPHAWVEVSLDGEWVRVDPIRGEIPAGGLYVDLGDGSSLSARLRAITAALRGASLTVVGD